MSACTPPPPPLPPHADVHSPEQREPPRAHLLIPRPSLLGCRWYAYRAPFTTLRDMAKTTEVAHRGSLLRFCAADSAALEAAYRRRSDEVERVWWEEEARVQPASGGRVSPIPEPTLPSTHSWQHFMSGGGGSSGAGGSGEAGAGGRGEEEAPGVLVRGGAHEVDLATRLLKPCYWPEGCHRVLRATW